MKRNLNLIPMILGVVALTFLGAIPTVQTAQNEETPSKSESTTSFTGTSKRGDLAEALKDAIQQAKESLHTDFVTWTMEKISGKNGGFAEADEISVTITASGPSRTER